MNTATTPHALNPVIARARQDFNPADKLGSTLSLLNSVCAVLHAINPERVPSRAAYQPSATQSEDRSAANTLSAELYGAFLGGRISMRSMVRAAQTLARYADLLRTAGLDY